jgi:hypothetical protein
MTRTTPITEAEDLEEAMAEDMGIVNRRHHPITVDITVMDTTMDMATVMDTTVESESGWKRSVDG